MAIKVMGVTSGRKESNSELLLKEALIACEKEGADVTMINLRDYHILGCTGCASCMLGMFQGRNVGCTLDEKDDKKRIMDVLLQQDALIVSVPTYDLLPDAGYLTFAQRNLSYESALLEAVGQIDHRDRVAGLISVGSTTYSWQSMTLEALQASMLHIDMKVVDMMRAEHLPAPAQVVLREELLERASLLGTHVMMAAKTPVCERTWLGDKDMGWCPNCHSNALIRSARGEGSSGYPVECQVCGAGGTLRATKAGTWEFVITEDSRSRDRTNAAGRATHLNEVERIRDELLADPQLRTITAKKLARYKSKQFKGIEGI